MRKSFSKTSTPMLAGVVNELTSSSAVATIKNCEYHGATGMDLHISCLEDEFKSVESLKSIIDSARIHVLALNYNLSYDKGFYEDTEENRTNLLFMAIEAGATVDIQGYTFDLPSKSAFRQEYSQLGYSFIKNNPKEVVVDNATIGKQTEFIKKVHHSGAEVLLSNHMGISMKAEELVDLALFFKRTQTGCYKACYPCFSPAYLAHKF